MRDLRIQDSLYGVLDLNSFERRIVDSPSFQRLLSVKQLGFAYAAFPGADYSRFSHSIGACSVMTRTLEALSRYGNYDVDDTNRKIYRFAALLHDIGHYPFSHAVEHALARRYQGDATAEAATREGALPADYLKHEDVGIAILDLDKGVADAVYASGVDTRAVKAVILKADPSRLTELVSSDVDVDRMDYLLRTAHHTGLPYGRIDQQYLVREARVDRAGRLCWSRRALAALDHLLLARYHDYQQIVDNKTVVAMEEVLKDVVFRLTDPALGNEGLNLTADGVRNKIRDGSWARFDDHALFERIKSVKTVPALSGETEFRRKCDALVDRNPPRRVAEKSKVDEASFDLIFKSFVSALPGIRDELSAKYNISKELWWVWHNQRSFTSYKGSTPIASDDEEALGLVKLLVDEESRYSKLAILDEQSIIGRLYLQRKYMARLYVLIDHDFSLRTSIEKDAQELFEQAWRTATA